MIDISQAISAIANVPVVQVLFVIVLVAIAERVGIPVITLFKALLKLNGNGNGKDHGPLNGSTEAIRALIAEVLSSQKQLAGHFNHETTDLLTRISEGVEQLNRKHEEWEKFGIPTRDCEKKK